MKHQSMKDRMHESEGMMHKMHKSHHSLYKNEVEMPEMPMEHYISPKENMGYGMRDFKGEADPIAYGQSGEPGCHSDEKKIHAQFKDYHWA